MARRKKPENETVEEAAARKRIEAVADAATRSEKVAWDRKMTNMVTLLARLEPLEQQILEAMAQKQPIMDEVAALRQTMVDECVHPITHLVDTPNGVVCKFCNRVTRANVDS